jgi:hypothetical protein
MSAYLKVMTVRPSDRETLPHLDLQEVLNLAQHLQPGDNLLTPLLLPNVCSKMT